MQRNDFLRHTAKQLEYSRVQGTSLLHRTCFFTQGTVRTVPQNVFPVTETLNQRDQFDFQIPRISCNFKNIFPCKCAGMTDLRQRFVRKLVFIFNQTAIDFPLRQLMQMTQQGFFFPDNPLQVQHGDAVRDICVVLNHSDEGKSILLFQ